MSEFINTVDLLGDDAVIDGIIQRTITEFKDDRITSVGNSAFVNCIALVDVNLPKVTSLASQSFRGCTSLENIDLPEFVGKGWNANAGAFENLSKLKTVNLPKLGYIDSSMFKGCSSLESIYLPNAKSYGPNGGIDYGMNAFQNCSKLASAVLPKASCISGYYFTSCGSLKLIDLSACIKIYNNSTFLGCTKLVALILRNTETVCTLSSSGAFNNTPIASGAGYIYVPAALLEDYKAATNWSTYASKFRALEDYTVDGTVTGELDETKI